jgi:hypothetical protein
MGWWLIRWQDRMRECRIERGGVMICVCAESDDVRGSEVKSESDVSVSGYGYGWLCCYVCR